MADQKAKVPQVNSEFRYLPPPREEFQWSNDDEGFLDKFTRKAKSNIFVPIGLGLTTVILGLGLFQMKTGNKHKSQFYMRARIGAQGITIAALLMGVWYDANKQKFTSTQSDAPAR